MSKKALRKVYLEKRKQLSSPDVSIQICKAAIALPQFISAKNVMIYMASNFEVETDYIIAWAKKCGKTICAPRVLNETEMEAAVLDEKGLKKGPFHIWEPRGKAVSSVDLVFVPGIAFDKSCHRLGYGKGYYDRFLEKINAFTVGLAYSFQVIDNIPTDSHDVRLNMILTEHEVYQ